MLSPINLSQAISHSSQRREGEPIVVIPKHNMEWIKHDGKGMPVDGETLVLVRFRDGQESTVPKAAKAAGRCWWRSTMAPFTVIDAYCVCPTEDA